MGKTTSPWRQDPEFLAVAEKTWPEDLRVSDILNGGYTSGQRASATFKLLMRWQGFRAARPSQDKAEK